MTSQPFGFHISPHGTNETQIREIARRSGARSHTILHSAGLANAVYEEAVTGGVKDPIIVLRADWPDQDWTKAPFNDPDKFVHERAHLAGQRLYLQYLNEPVVTNMAQLNDLLDKCIAFMDACEKYGVKGSVGGFADASLFQQAWIEARLFDRFLRRAVKWTRAGHGVINHHDYSEGCPMKNGGGHSERDMLDPARMQPDNWPTAADMQQPAPGGFLAFTAQVAPDFDAEIAYQAAVFLTAGRGLRREYDYARRLFFAAHGETPDVYLQTHVVAQAADYNWTAMRYMWPLLRSRKLEGQGYLFIVGEYGPQDDMPHLRASGFTQELERKAANGRKLRGPLEQADFYAFWWPQWSREEAHIRVLRWQAGVIPEECLGYTIFALNEDNEWVSFNYRRWPAIWQPFYALTDELRRATPVATVPKPTIGRKAATLVKVAQQYVNVREQPTTASRDLGDLYPGTSVYYFPAAETNGFVYVEARDVTPALEGWVSLLGGQVVFDEAGAPPFTLGNPVAFPWQYSDKFNALRNYQHLGAGYKQLHEGVDLIPQPGVSGPYTVIAAQSGVVEQVGNDSDGYGHYVRIRHDWHGQQFKTWYAHLAPNSIPASVKAGAAVLKGDALGLMGASGYVSGPHLHFTLQHIGRGLSGYVVADVVDPETYLPAPPVVVPEPEEPDIPDALYAVLTSDELVQLAELHTSIAGIYRTASARLKTP